MPFQPAAKASLAATALACLLVSGCYVPGGGWTMRTGVDLRRHRKPSLFCELVDTRWDEYNRVAEQNLSLGLVDPRTVVTPTNSTGNGLVAPLPGNGTEVQIPQGGVPPATPPVPNQTVPGDTTVPGPLLNEPRQLPGAPADPVPPPPPGVSATALRPRGPELLPQPDKDVDDDDDTDDEDKDERADAGAGDQVELSSYQRRTGTRASGAADSSAGKVLRRPSASRLFRR